MSLHISAQCSRKMGVNDNLGNPRLLQRNYSSKCLQLRNVLADNIQFVAHHKNYIKKG